MNKNESLKGLVRLMAAAALCLCLLMTAASAAGLDGQNDGENTGAGNAQDTLTAKAAASTLFTEEQALALVRNALKADDTWQLTTVGTVDIAGVTYYRVIAIDPVGDARSRLVDANTGEITVENLWDIAQNGEGKRKGDKDDEDENQDKDEQEDDKDSEDDNTDNDVNGDNTDNTDNTDNGADNQQDGEFETVDEESLATDAVQALPQA